MASPVQGFNPSPVIGVTIKTQKADPDRVLRIAQAKDYPKQVLYLLASFAALVALWHFLSILATVAFSKRSKQASAARSSVSIRRLPTAILNVFRSVAFRSTIPVGKYHTLNIAEVFLTAAYITIIFTWPMINSTNTLGQRYDPKYWANTAGNIASTQLSVVTVLGMRNNLLSWATGISFDKLNYLHRMTARALAILTWVHGAGRIMLGVTGAVSWSHPYIQVGVLASTALTVLSIISLRPLRERGYEFFAVAHFLLAFITLLSAYFHAEGLEFGYLVWPAFLLWGLDRLIRVIRVLAINHGYFTSKNASQRLDATVEVLSPHFLRLKVKRPNFFHWRPGQSAYLTMPEVSTLPFEAHPFTIATIDAPTVSASNGSATPPSPTDTEEKNVGQSAPEQATEAGSGKELVFLVRVRHGFTQRLLKEATDEHTFKVLVDGPYSSPPWLRGYDSVILIAGGSGIGFTLPLLLDLVYKAKNDRRTECRRVVFIWAIREIEHVQWVSSSLGAALRDLPSSLSVEIRIYITAEADQEQPDAQALDDDSQHTDTEHKADAKNAPRAAGLLQMQAVQVLQGRPALKTIIDEETQRASGSMAVNVCGTHALASAVRSALRAPRFMDVLKGGPSITLHVEAFGSS
ncbi:hypothetical protein HGRIS_011244 [Hohenbuehelia grisea]|uniref:ferric-chelate reductase (NADPH) n=1 Tax=Hohenbuehelia grisea TaxID=104357 RepID=A0ABR3JWP7_9AGAR